MARIRSVHPGQWTDEEFVACSPLARLFALGLRNEADDNGIFDWNPIKLKMRIFPADNVDIVALLEELVAHRQIGHYEVSGRKYGAIRNFRKYQRPKSPSALYPIPHEWREYVALDQPISEIIKDDDPPFPKSGETPPQMEEVGGKRKRGTVEDARSRTLAGELASEAEKLCGFDDPLAIPSGFCGFEGRIEAGLQTGWTRDDVLNGIRKGLSTLNGVPPDSYRYFEKPIARAFAERTAPIPVANGTSHATPAKRSEITAALDEHIRTFREASRDDGDGSGAGEGHARLLSHG